MGISIGSCYSVKGIDSFEGGAYYCSSEGAGMFSLFDWSSVCTAALESRLSTCLVVEDYCGVAATSESASPSFKILTLVPF